MVLRIEDIFQKWSDQNFWLMDKLLIAHPDDFSRTEKKGKAFLILVASRKFWDDSYKLC